MSPQKSIQVAIAPNTDNYVMRIIPLRHVDSSEITRSFRTFMSRHGRIIEIKQTNTIIVQDTGENINRLVRLIRFVDIPGHEETLQIIPVKYSSAQEIATLLDKILQKNDPRARRRGGSSSSTIRGSTLKRATISKIIAEPRTNTIIAMANAQGAQRLRLFNKKIRC